MRGWVTANGGIQWADDFAEPEPASDQIILGVRAYSVNRGELALIAERPDGFRPGQDVSGVVVRAAAHGGPPVGTRVVALLDWSGWSERVAVPVAHLAVLPDRVGFVEAATLPVAGITALRAVRLAGDLLGRCVLVTGAAGGVGQVAVQLAVAAGARVTALVRERQADEARELGAHDVMTSLGDVSRRFDVILDGIGGATLVHALRHLVPSGTVVMYGVLDGKAALDIFDFAPCPNARLVGMFLNEPGATAGDELTTLALLLAEGRLRPVIGLTEDWTLTPEVLLAVQGRRVRGKAVLTLG